MEAPELLERLEADGLTIAVAESCTGGRLTARLIEIAGASKVVKGGIVAYDDQVKTGALGVHPRLIERFGSVSAAVAEAMAHGARDKLDADIGVAVTGIAGPTGERPGKPIGTVWFAVIGPEKVLNVQRSHFDGDRTQIMDQAVEEALVNIVENFIEAEREGQVEASA